MKKIFFTLVAIAAPLLMNAQSEGLFARKAPAGKHQADMSAYTKAGAVPVVDGKVLFGDVIAAPGKSKADIYMKLAQWASLRYEPNSTYGVWTDKEFFQNIEYSKVKIADKERGEIICQGAEELIFSIKPLAKNYTQAYYTLNLKVEDGKVLFSLNSLSFNVDQGEGKFVRETAEDWITDEECINKKGELRKIPGKFRIKTIDLVNELKREISITINE